MESTAVAELHKVSKSYPGFRLGEVTLSIPAGYVTGIIGPNGAGKTTLIKLLLGAVRADSGAIRIFGLDVVKNRIRVNERVGFVHESPPFYDTFSVDRFARLIGGFYSRWSSERFSNLARRFELPGKKKIRALSRGMKMKLAIAMALCHDAELLILDEPTSGLDPIFRREFLDTLREMLIDERRSVIFSTHITSDLEQLADNVIYLRSGRVQFSESAELIRDRWRIVKGPNDLLSSGNKDLFRACRSGSYGFIALSDKPEEVIRSFGDQVIVERASFDDLVFHLDEEAENG